MALIDRYERREEMVVSEQIDVGDTTSCFDAMKVVPVLQWLIDWAEYGGHGLYR